MLLIKSYEVDAVIIPLFRNRGTEKLENSPKASGTDGIKPKLPDSRIQALNHLAIWPL